MQRNTLAAALFLFILTQAHAASNQEPLVVPFKTVGSLMLVDVRINGEPKRMIFDSGAQRTALNAKTQQDHVLTGIIDVGRFRWFNFPIILTNMSNMFNVLGEGDGVLGQDFLRDFKTVTIDYKTNTITLSK